MPQELYGVRGEFGLQPTDAPVAPTRKVYFNQLVLNAPNDATDEEAAIGVPDNTMDILQGALSPAGGFNMAVNPSEMVELLLMAFRGGVTPTTPSGAVNARSWLYTIGPVVDKTTIQWQTALSGVWFRGGGYNINEFTIQGNANGTNRITATLFGQTITEMDGLGSNPAIPTPLADRPYPNPVQGWETMLFIDALGATPGVTAVPAFIIDWNLTFSNNQEREYAGQNSRNAAAVNRGMFKLSRAQITVRPSRAEAMLEYKHWRNNEGRLLQLVFGNNKVIDTGVAEIQSVVATGATSGTFLATFQGQSATIPWNATAAQFSTLINSLANVGNNPPGFICAGGPLPATPITLTGAGQFAQGNIPQLTADNTALVGGTAVFTTTTPGTGYKEAVKVTMPGKWRAFDPSQSGAAARNFRFDYSAIRDPTLATMAQIELINARTAAWTNS